MLLPVVVFWLVLMAMLLLALVTAIGAKMLTEAMPDNVSVVPLLQAVNELVALLGMVTLPPK